MRVVIVGGGIGGLVTALSLHAAGISDVVVAEAVARVRPFGVGINLLPHAVRELTELGLADQLATVGVATAELAYYSRHGVRIWSEPRGLGAGYLWPQYSVHRGQLQMMLLAAVLERLGDATVRTGHVLGGLRQEGSTVIAHFTTAAGEAELAGDVVIGADGIHSAVRALHYPREGPPPWNGLVLWRGVTRARPFLTGRSMIMAGDGTSKFVAYPVGEGEDGLSVVNWIAERPMTEAVARGDWNRAVAPEEIVGYFGDWRFDWLDIPALISATEAVFEYPMVDRDPLPRWSHGRVTLLGDAAHAMYPIGSNGASQAVLDARVLAYELAVGPSPEQALTAYEERRRPVTTALCQANRGMGPEIVMKLVHERAPEGFTDVEQVMPLAERESIAASYKRIAGFDPSLLNERPSYDAAPACDPV